MAIGAATLGLAGAGALLATSYRPAPDEPAVVEADTDTTDADPA
jgi:hypothetical protein